MNLRLKGRNAARTRSNEMAVRFTRDAISGTCLDAIMRSLFHRLQRLPIRAILKGPETAPTKRSTIDG